MPKEMFILDFLAALFGWLFLTLQDFFPKKYAQEQRSEHTL